MQNFQCEYFRHTAQDFKSGMMPSEDVICVYYNNTHISTNESYYLKHSQFVLYQHKTRGAVERFISDKARIASV